MTTCPSRPATWRGLSVLLTVSLFAWMGCGGSDGGITEPPTNPPPTTPTVSQISLSTDSLFFGGLTLSRSLTAQARAADGTVVSGATISWQSSSMAVATVTASGSVTAVAPGQADITASSGTVSSVVKVVVEQVPAGLAVTPGSLALDSLGALGAFQASQVDSGGVAIPGGIDVEWTSTDGAVAVVGIDGVVEARGPGTSKVVATDASGASAEADVAVSIPALAGIVDAGGGTVTAAGGRAVLTLEAGAVPYSVALTATEAQPSSTQDLVTGTAVTFGPDLTFAAPVDLAIAYDPTGIPANADERSLGLYRLTGSSWEELDDIAVDTTSNKVVARVTSTGTFAVLAGRQGDPTGLWLVTETTTFDSCYDEAGLVEEISVYAEKNGNTLSVERDGETVSGTLVGDEFGWDEEYVVDGVDVRETYSITIARTGLTATGTGRFVGSGPVSCEIRTQLNAKRTGRDRPQAATGVQSLTLTFVESPGLTRREWRPDVGDGVRLLVTAKDGNGITVPNTSIVFAFTEGRVLQNPPLGAITGTEVTLAPGLVGTTEVTAVAVAADGSTVRSAPLTIQLLRDTTSVRLIAPPQGVGRFFDLEPLLVWEDDNGEADRWEVVAGSQRLPLRLRRNATGASRCAVGDRCVDQVRGLWAALGPAGDTPFVRLEGVNALGHVVSRSTFDFTHVVRNTIELQANGVPLWTTQGNGFSPTGSSPANTYPNSKALYCTEAAVPGCLHAYVQTQWTAHHQILVVERRPNQGDWEAARIWLPNKLLDGTVTQAPWNCTRDNGNLALEDVAIVNFRWLDNGQIRSASGSNDSADPNPKACNGGVTVGVEEYKDIRGTWRIFTVQGSGSMITPLGVQNVAFAVTGAVKWADGEIEPPRFWVEGIER